MIPLEQEVERLLHIKKLNLGVVESATGGLISHRITNAEGISSHYQGAITSYSNTIKVKLVGVKPATLERYGAVSAQVAEEMASGGARVLGVDICVSDTGIAGPGGATPDKPLGLFFIGLYHAGKVYSRRYVFQGDRLANKESAAHAALSWLRDYLAEL